MDGGPGDFLGDDAPLSVQGVKVLSKPADYDFKDAVGKEYSDNYYNLFAWEILNALYKVYEDDSVQVRLENEKEVSRTKIYEGLDTENGTTFPIKVDENGKPINPDISEKEHYLFDTLRYTITNVENVYDSGILTSVKVVWNANTRWQWTIDNATLNYKTNDFKPDPTKDASKATIFDKTSAVLESLSKTDHKNISFTFKGEGNDGDIISEWTEIYDIGDTKIDFSEFYNYKDGQVKIKDTQNTDYWISPYYNIKADEGVASDAVNFFQDALEYAIYLFVLGYDYNADVADGPYFDFEVIYDDNGFVSDVKVGGWGNEKISVSKGGENSALGKVKKMYQEFGGYVGITRLAEGEVGEGKTNQEQIENFIKDKIIGQEAYEQNIFQVKHITKQDGVTSLEETKKYNRNYDKIISNIVQYACTQAPIGMSDEGEVLTLDENYLASQITDYAGNYFGASYKDNQDNNLFEFIPAAEYQSIVIYPNEKDFNINYLQNKFQAIGDIWLAFEYWDDPRDTITPDADKEKARDKENGIVINVGFKYFDHEKGEFTANESVQKKVSYGQFPSYKNEDGSLNPNFEEEYENHVASFSDSGTGTDREIGTVAIKTKFNYSIGNNAINPFASGTEIEAEHKSITINGKSRAREYYKTNTSSSYGVYGSLNPDKFVGEDGCDFIEIYFDIVKTKGVVGKNYNFKVALYNFLAADDVYAQK